MLVNYKNNLIKVIPSGNYHFWFGLYINQVFQGEWRSVEEGIEEGKYFINNAIDKLKSIDQTTIIDDVLSEYLNIEQLNSLKLLTGYNGYDEILAMFEGFTIKRLLKYYC
jgi:hypothetical protein